MLTVPQWWEKGLNFNDQLNSGDPGVSLFCGRLGGLRVVLHRECNSFILTDGHL